MTTSLEALELAIEQAPAIHVPDLAIDDIMVPQIPLKGEVEFLGKCDAAHIPVVTADRDLVHAHGVEQVFD